MKQTFGTVTVAFDLSRGVITAGDVVCETMEYGHDLPAPSTILEEF